MFLRDGDMVAAHMDGTLAVDGVENGFESFVFAKVDGATGKLEWVVERNAWDKLGEAPH